MAEHYWLNLFTETTWRESVAQGLSVAGHRESAFAQAQNVAVGDYLLCWVTGASRVVALQQVTGAAYRVSDTTDARIWAGELYPVRLPVELVRRVPIHDGVHLAEIRQASDDPSVWGWVYRRSLTAVPPHDAAWIVGELEKRSQVPAAEPEPEPTPATVPPERNTQHTETQYRLAKLGREMGLRVWIAKNDRNDAFNGDRLGDLSEDELIGSYPREAKRRIELIDVIWMTDDRYVAAFEVEVTTPPLMDLARMGDLVAVLPNVDIPLFIVAPEMRRGKVFDELSRPLFTRGDAALARMCRYIAFEELFRALEQVGSFSGALKPEEFLGRVAEPVP